MTIDEVVSDYIRVHRQVAGDEMSFFKKLQSLTEALKNAVRPGGRKHDHQFRIPVDVLNEAERRLQASADDLLLAPDFAALHDLVERAISPARGIGELAVYDISLRVGAFLGKGPALVYLHRGTRAGAATLGFRGKVIDPKLLPATFSRLTAAEIEDCLCIYKDQLDGRDLRTRVIKKASHCNSVHFPERQKC